MAQSRTTRSVGERLLTRHEASGLVGIHPTNWREYADRWPMLRAGARVVRVSAGSRGRMKWLRSAVEEHISEELLRGEPAAR